MKGPRQPPGKRLGRAPGGLIGYLLSPMGPEADYKTAILEAVSDPESFLRLTLSHPRGETACNRVSVRMVEIRNAPHLQISRFSRTQDITENTPLAGAGAALDELLALPFTQIHVQTSREDLHVRG